jgi:hypothetical protein
MMTGLEALQSGQYVSAKGKRFAVLSIEDWEALIDWLETLEDVAAAQEALRQLKDAGMDRSAAGWKQWDAIRDEFE